MYYGDEIGMRNVPIPKEEWQDPQGLLMPDKDLSRDPQRTPMQWDGTRNAGFSPARKTWLPVQVNFPLINVKKQQDEPTSLLNTVKTLLKIRHQEECLKAGSLEVLENLPASVLGYVRKWEDRKIAVLLNFDEREKKFMLETAEKLFGISPEDRTENGAIHLAPYGGLLLNIL